MVKSWFITGDGIAKIIRSATHRLTCKLGDLVAAPSVECSKCKHPIDNNDVILHWPGLPAGVKFEPSDQELLEHLKGKVNLGISEPHVLIDNFIPTLEHVEGICYTHPENLPGVKMDGSSSFFFHKTANAYGCGQRKRRKICNGDGTIHDENIRWHKTGRSRAISHNGVKIGWKKILVLYKGPKTQGSNANNKDNWVMHQYHLGVEEGEMDGEYVVSRIYWQLPSKQIDKPAMDDVDEAPGSLTVQNDPRTPKTNTPQKHRPTNSPCETFPDQEGESGTSILGAKEEPQYSGRYAGTSQAVENSDEALQNLQKDLPYFDWPSNDEFHGSSPNLHNFSLTEEGETGTSTHRPKDEAEYSPLYAGTSQDVDNGLNEALLLNEPLQGPDACLDRPPPPLDCASNGVDEHRAWSLAMDVVSLADFQFGSQDSFSWADTM